MSESGQHSDTSESVDEDSEYSEDNDGGSDGSEYTDESEYSGSGDNTDHDDQPSEGRREAVDEDYSDGVEESVNVARRKVGKGKGGGERERLLLPLHNKADYSPDRWPPLLDFMFVFSSFVAAVVAAYFTLF